jgi:tripartite-type tricarboxylate transporter receptor subunit TctC
MLGLTSVHADSVADFYRDKTLTVIVGFEPGGGYDLIGRLLARHVGRFIPGRPTAIVQNMPGAGTLVTANYLYNVAPKTGATFGLLARNMPLLAVIGQNANVRFDPTRLNWIGSSSDYSADSYILIARKNAVVKTLQDAQRHDSPPLVIGGSAPGAAGADVPRILREALDLNLKIILGYVGSAKLFLALERGEIDAITTDLSAIKSYRPQWLEPGSNFHVLLQFARTSRHPELPTVPTARELATTDASRQLIEYAETPFSMAMPFAAPPDIPEERLTLLRTAFDEVHRDPEYLADAAARGEDVSPARGADVAEVVSKLSAMPPDIRARLGSLITPDRAR